jgi:hypothetical protein
MVVGDRECALMCAKRAQTCAQHYTSSIGGQTAGSIGLKIGSLELCDEDRGVGDRECALVRAQMCAQHHISSIGGQTAGPIEPQIDTNTHWDNGQKLWGSGRREHAARNRDGTALLREMEA